MTLDVQAGPPGADGFDRHAARYASEWGRDPVARRMRRVVHDVADAALPAGGRIIDVGCGVGIDLAWLVGTGRSAVGVDASEGMVGQARAAVPDVPIFQMSIADLRDGPPLGSDGQAPANSTSFDGALLNFGVLNCAPLDDTAAALAVLLRTGGVVVGVPMPRLAPTWLLSRLLHGDVAAVRSRLGSMADVSVAGGVVRTWYWTDRAIRRAFSPWFDLEQRVGLGFVLPPPGTRWSEWALDVADAVERPLRRLPVLRTLGDHVIVVLRRNEAPAPRR